MSNLFLVFLLLLTLNKEMLAENTNQCHNVNE